MTTDQHARRIISALPAQLRSSLAANPLQGLRAAGLIVQAVPELTSARGHGGMCDGLSFTAHGAILYAPTPESRRENFTLLHEYAHLLIHADMLAPVWLADLEHPEREEEALCDQIAALLLVPDTLLDQVVGPGPVTGLHVLDLFRRSPAASQIVCAIAVARRLHCTGAVLLTDRQTHTVVFASLAQDPPVYPSTNQAVPHGHPLRSLQPGQQIAGKTFWETPWGSPHRFYLNAAASTRRTYAVLCSDDLWGIDRFHTPTEARVPDARPQQLLTCACGYRGPARGWPCPDCAQLFCPRCGRCDCARRAKQQDTCSRCGLTVPRIDLEGGVCSGCR